MAGPSAGFDRPTLRLDSDNRRRYIMLLVSPREKRSGTTKITKTVQVAPRAHAGLHASALSRSARLHAGGPRNRPARTAGEREGGEHVRRAGSRFGPFAEEPRCERVHRLDRKSTRLNSSHDQISYAVFCLKKKKKRNLLFISVF